MFSVLVPVINSSRSLEVRPHGNRTDGRRRRRRERQSRGAALRCECVRRPHGRDATRRRARARGGTVQTTRIATHGSPPCDAVHAEHFFKTIGTTQLFIQAGQLSAFQSSLRSTEATSRCEFTKIPVEIFYYEVNIM